ncbi:hypothetical protein A3H38_01670 [candidate division WOR-1 bacterium RIFCSPLOWO2_02_FULL_46_20]|uniref:Response regulatory domain-containing protein n=1 Tax=candidate division WOR-1 bacterium RIFCSPLOWO2_02_FULL_46_20 TaxID=1802567 RepID=A0A1F4RH55_UNCSA|nr:MAG: hypothetical protein A3H38_01670 [candidate division WOR-1 bacterium RIFCSPLOWO2_02_FULL_46_20]
MKKTILLIEDEPKVEAVFREALGKGYVIEVVPGAKLAAAFIDKKIPDIVVIDFDLKNEDGLRVFERLGLAAPTIMMSSSGNISLAVSATKLGVVEFLRKPLNVEQLREAVEQNISQEERPLRLGAGLAWLWGEGHGLKEMFSGIQHALRANKDVVLVGGRGIESGGVAELIHQHSAKRDRRLVRFDIAAFRRQDLETHFWATLQDLLSLPAATSLRKNENLCGTIYLENIERVDEHFKLSLLKYFNERKGKTVRAVLGVNSRDAILTQNDYVVVEIPKLRERKEDLPYLLSLYLKGYSVKYNKEVKFISREVLADLAAYDFPGNYAELEELVREAVLVAAADKLEAKNLAYTYKILQQAYGGLNLPLDAAKLEFENSLYNILLDKSNGDEARLARFLNVPRSVLSERIQNLLN